MDMASVVGIPIAQGLWFHAATVEDIHFRLQPPASELLLAFEGDEIVGSIMMGNDGHRGWVYYLGVSPAWRRGGVARLLMAQAEQ